MKEIYKNIGLAVSIALLLGSCKLTQTADNKAVGQLPKQYMVTGSEKANGATMPQWQQYFQDTLLLSLIDAALANNYDLLQAYQRIEMSRASVKYAKGLALPFVGVAATAGQQKFGKYTMDGVGNYDTNFSSNIQENQKMPENLPDFSVGFQSQWEIDVWGKLRNKKKAALARYLATTEGKNWLQTNLIAQVAMGYYELLALDRELEILSATNELQVEALEIIKLQKEAGNVNELAVNQFEAQLYNFQTMEIQARQNKIEAASRLNLLIGKYPTGIVTAMASFTDSLPPINAGTPEQLLTRRPDIRQAEWLLQASKADLLSARAALYPSLQLSGFLGYQAFSSALLFDPSSLAYQFFGGLFGPVINRSALNAEWKYAGAAQQEAFLQYQQAVMVAYMEVYNQLNALDNLEKIVSLKGSEVAALSRASETSVQLFSSGRANYLEVIIARKNGLQAQIELIEARKERYFAHINLYRALGGG